MKALRIAGGLAVGFVCAALVARLLFAVLQGAWPQYAAAVPDKSYSLLMLWSRLGIATVVVLVSSFACRLIAGDRRVAGALGVLFVFVSLPSHLHYSWAEYPFWYHAIYVLSLVPLAWFGGGLAAGRKAPAA